MVTVSVSVYDDADLLKNALASIRDVLGNVRIQVVDGKYETFKPDATPNSTDDTRAVCDAYGAEYWPDGPFPLERDKHVRRVERAPEGERVLFMDADERLLDWNEDALPEDEAIGPRIYNALTYGPHAVYWPRLFRPEWVKTINRWDAYLFDAPYSKSDAVTILHRHDLRDRDYRIEKYDRFEREDRVGRYDDRFDQYLADDWDADIDTCPECGSESLTRSQVTNYDPEGAYSYVEACVNGDGCHAAIGRVEPGDWRYLPDDWERAFESDPERLRLELMDAGCSFVRQCSVEYMVENMRPVIGLWINEHLGEAEPEVFA